MIVTQDLTRREYERQFEITKYELLRLSSIRNDLAKIVAQFCAAMKEYSLGVKKLFEDYEGSTVAKSKMSKIDPPPA